MADVPVARIWIKDFRCLKEIDMNFVDSPIISLIAHNDSGKSSIVKAIESTVYNDNESLSKRYIRTNTKGWKVRIELADGTAVERERTAAANSYRLFDNTGKLTNEYSKLDKAAVPPAIQKLFNVFIEETTGELLNIRTCESLLLFSLTKASDNYKVMYGGLKVEQLSKAIELGKKRIKELSDGMRTASAIIDDYTTKLKMIKIPDTEALDKLYERVDTTCEIIEGLEDLQNKILYSQRLKRESVMAEGLLVNVTPINMNWAYRLQQLDTVVKLNSGIERTRKLNDLYEELSGVTEVHPDKLENLGRLASLVQLSKKSVTIEKELDGVADLEGLHSVDVSIVERLEKLRTLAQSAKELAVKRKSFALADEVSGIASVDLNKFNSFQQLLQLIAERKSKESELSMVEKELSDLQSAIDEKVAQENAGRVRFADGSLIVKCDSCGEETAVALNNVF